MKFLRRTLWVSLGLFVVLNVMLAFQAYRFTYFYDNPQKIQTRRAEDYSTSEKLQGALFGIKFLKSVVDHYPTEPFQTVRFANEKGEMLEGWYIPVQQAKGTVILCHGHTQNKAKILDETAYFHELGYNTFSFDFRAHGNSGGNICTIGYFETGDLKAAYDFMTRKGEKNIVLWGVSMGAATILKAISECHLQPKQVILECPFASMYEAVEGRIRTMHLPAHPLSELLLVWGSVERGMWSFGYRPAEYATQLTMPVLLNWGAHDARVLRHETDEIFTNLDSDQKQLVVFSKSRHESFCKKEPLKWRISVKQFLRQASKPNPAHRPEPYLASH